MSELKDRIKALEKLGYFFSHISEVDSRYDTFFDAIDRAQIQNGWFQKKSLYNSHTILGICASAR